MTTAQPSTPYLSNREMKYLEELLGKALDDTFNCWSRTRINGASASLACDGNVCVPLLKYFDKVRKLSNQTGETK